MRPKTRHNLTRSTREDGAALNRVASDFDCTVDHVGVTGSGHHRWKIKCAVTGRACTLFSANSSSDWRAWKNKLARARKMCREISADG